MAHAFPRAAHAPPFDRCFCTDAVAATPLRCSDGYCGTHVTFVSKAAGQTGAGGALVSKEAQRIDRRQASLS